MANNIQNLHQLNDLLFKKESKITKLKDINFTQIFNLLIKILNKFDLFINDFILYYLLFCLHIIKSLPI